MRNIFKDDNKVRVSPTSITTFIGDDTTVEGTLITHSSVRIDGKIVGGVVADGTVVLSQNGEIQGNVIAENIIVAGVVDGNLNIKDKTNIEPTGEVYGDITTARVLIDEQSVFQGKCNMNIDRSKNKRGRFRLKETAAAKKEEQETAEVRKEAEVKKETTGKKEATVSKEPEVKETAIKQEKNEPEKDTTRSE